MKKFLIAVVLASLVALACPALASVKVIPCKPKKGDRIPVQQFCTRCGKAYISVHVCSSSEKGKTQQIIIEH